MATTPDPFSTTFPTPHPPVSKNEFPIAGITTTVYGLDDLPDATKEVSCLWLLHPRLKTRESMEPIAVALISEWNRKRTHAGRGLICASFDQRNHGSRLVDGLANEAWRQGNPRHAQDMHSVFRGTYVDTALLIDYLPAYAFPTDQHIITSHMVLGVSLGGHAAWQCILHSPRITTAVIVIGCADYASVMSHRAEKSKLKSWTSTSPPGAGFLGSTDFPKALVEAVARWDPAVLLMRGAVGKGEPSEEEKVRLVPLMKECLAGKRIFNLAGGADKLVPYSCSEPFMGWLKKAVGPGGWFEGNGVVVKDTVYEGVGHEMTPGMMRDAVDFVIETMAGDRGGVSKM